MHKICKPEKNFFCLVISIIVFFILFCIFFWVFVLKPCFRYFYRIFAKSVWLTPGQKNNVHCFSLSFFTLNCCIYIDHFSFTMKNSLFLSLVHMFYLPRFYNHRYFQARDTKTGMLINTGILAKLLFYTTVVNLVALLRKKKKKHVKWRLTFKASCKWIPWEKQKQSLSSPKRCHSIFFSKSHFLSGYYSL